MDQYCDDVIPGKVKVKKVLETKTVLAFYAREPLWPTHIIVIPKKHISSLLEFQTVEDQIIVEIMQAIAHIAKQLIETQGKCRIMTNVGDYQHTKHLHWHIYIEE